MTDTPAPLPSLNFDAPVIATGTRLLIPEDYVPHFECTACGVNLRGVQGVVAVPRNQKGYTMYSLVHNSEDCIAAVT